MEDQCAVCNSKKSSFIKKQEKIALLGKKIPLRIFYHGCIICYFKRVEKYLTNSIIFMIFT